jgi:Family of unknown function (DUF6328)
MSSLPDDDPVKRSSSEKYDRVGASLRWSQILAAASSIFFGFVLKIAVNPPSYFQLFDNLVLLAALYAVTTATAMFIMPVVHHMLHYHKFDVEKYLLATKKYTLIGIICVMLAMYLGLGLSLNSKVPTEIAYGLALLPFMIIFIRFYRHLPSNLVESTSTEDYDRVGAGMRWCQILAAASSIFFGFLLNITVSQPVYFQLLDNIVLLASLYAVAAATVMFIMPVIYHSNNYLRFDVAKFLLVTKEYVTIGIICVMLAMYLGLGLSLNSKVPTEIAYGAASLPFVAIFVWFLRNRPKITTNNPT